MSPFWQGFTLFPFVVAIILFVVWAYTRWYRAVVSWYIGLPWVAWLAMTLIAIGLKHMHAKHCRTKRADGRLWFSPLSDKFIDQEAGR